MLKRPHYIALGLVVLLTLVILNLPSQTTARLKLGIGSLFLPLFGLASFRAAAGRRGGRRRRAAAGIAQAERSPAPRKPAAALAGACRRRKPPRENARLRQLVGWQQQTAWKLKLAKVVLREPANWWRTVQIDLGSRDGLRVNLPVLTTDGLVGRISSVSLTRSQVVLLGDPNCKVSARVENETRDTGVIGASGPLETELVELGYLSRNANLKPGQNVVTSGDGGIFPEGHSDRQDRGCRSRWNTARASRRA